MSAVVAPAATSVANDWTRSGCPGGQFSPAAAASAALVVVQSTVEGAAAGHVGPCAPCVGLVVLVGARPRPPPSWPTITSEVGTVFVPLPVGKDRLFVRLIVRLVGPDGLVGTVITTGDQFVPANGFEAAQIAGLVATGVPQV